MMFSGLHKKGCNFRIHIKLQKNSISDLAKQHRQNMLRGEIIKKTFLSSEENHRVVMVRLEIENLNNGDIPARYSPGDHVAIYPHHDDEDVNFVMEHLTKKPTDSSRSYALYEYNQIDGKLIKISNTYLKL